MANMKEVEVLHWGNDYKKVFERVAIEYSYEDEDD